MIERVRALYRVRSSGLAAAALVVANLVPLAGVLLWDWDLATILVLYWIENGIVGLFTVPRMLLARGGLTGLFGKTATGGGLPTSRRDAEADPASALQKATLVPFFAVHYGLFWVVHGVFVFAIAGGLFSPEPSGDFGGPAPDLVALGAVGLLVSHGASFRLNYLGRREFLTTSPNAEMAAPYGRVVVLHLTIILGAIGVEALGSPIAALAVLVAAKTVLDLGAHLLEHARASARSVGAGSVADEGTVENPPVTVRP